MRTTLVASHYNATDKVFCTGAYEFSQIIAECEAADLLAPGTPSSQLKTEADRALALLSRKAGLGNRPHITPVHIKKKYDLFVYCAAWLRDIAELRRMSGWRRKSKKAVAFLFEAWPQNIKENKPHFKELRKFDLVICISESAAHELRKQSGANVVYLPCGADAERLCPFPDEKPRTIDVYAMGRQPVSQHDQLLSLSEKQDLFYLIDAPKGAFSVDFPMHVRNRANILKRTKIMPCYGLRAIENRKRDEAGDHDLIPMRFYDAAASGAFVIGEPPHLATYQKDFDWEDACVYASGQSHDYAGLVQSLLSDPDRMKRASQRSVINALRRHDWSYRWSAILQMLNLPGGPRLEERLLRLEALAVHVAGLG